MFAGHSYHQFIKLLHYVNIYENVIWISFPNYDYFILKWIRLKVPILIWGKLHRKKAKCAAIFFQNDKLDFSSTDNKCCSWCYHSNIFRTLER